MSSAAPDRIAALDLLRGLAVLGILTVNVSGFAGPPGAAYSPNIPNAASIADSWTYAAVLVLFEGKMRALFTLLFGASLLLFVERAEAQGRDGPVLQVRRLSWLALIGYLHFLLWWGDVLFLYAIAGMAALLLRRGPPAAWLASALLLFTCWQLWGLAISWDGTAQEAAVLSGNPTAAQAQGHARTIVLHRAQDAADLAEIRQGLTGIAATKLASRPFYPWRVTFYVIGETLSYVLVGMALLRSGFFSGGWSRRQLRIAAGLGLGVGGTATLAFAQWAMVRDWPEQHMRLAINFLLGFPHILMALGYGALAMLAAPRLLATPIGRRIAAAGRMALSNYIATSLVMCGLFYGWGLGLAGRFSSASEVWFVALGWALMLGWSRPWLTRFRQGPLEWAWRSVTEGRTLPLRR